MIFNLDFYQYLDSNPSLSQNKDPDRNFLQTQIRIRNPVWQPGQESLKILQIDPDPAGDPTMLEEDKSLWNGLK